MEKPFDVKDLVVRLKGKGLDMAEEAVKLCVVESLGWMEDSVKLSENKYDDLAIAVIPSVKDFVLKQVDKIDGAVG